jgi:transcriptional regulator with XRE-family HTH domain
MHQDFICYGDLNDTSFVVFDKNGKPMLHFVYPLRTISDDATIGEKIAFYRKKRNLFGNDLANLIGIDRVTMIRYENDQLDCPYDVIIRISEALNVDRHLLMDEYLQLIDYPYSVFIKQRRKELHLRQCDLGEQVGVTRRQVEKWEHGVCMLPKDRYHKLKEIHFIP